MTLFGLLRILAIWLTVSWSALRHGPSQAPCSYGALSLVLTLWTFGNACKRLHLGSDSHWQSRHSVQLPLYFAVLIITHFAEEFARLQILHRPDRPELFERRGCILCAVLEEDELLPVFDTLVGASLLVASVVFGRWLGPSAEGSVRLPCLPARMQIPIILWALAEAIQCSCYPFNYMAGKPHNLDRMLVLALGFLTIIVPGVGWWFVPWCVMMTSQFSWGLSGGHNARIVLWGIMWQLLLAVEAWRLVATFFPYLDLEWAAAVTRLLIGTHYFTAWAHKFACSWLSMYNETGSEAVHLWHWFAAGSYAFGTDQALGLLTAIPFQFTVWLGRRCEWLMAATAMYAQLACGLGFVAFPGSGACLCALMQFAFHLVVSVQSGHVFWGHSLACVGVAVMEFMRRHSLPQESVRANCDVQKHQDTSCRNQLARSMCNATPSASILQPSQFLAFALYNAFNIGHIVRNKYLSEKLLKSTRSWDPVFLGQPKLVLAFAAQRWPLEPYGGMHPALPTMAFVPSVGVSDWRINLQVPHGEKIEMDAYTFTPFATTLIRSDPSFLHDDFSALPWSRDGATGSPGFAALGARSAVHECSRMMLADNGEWSLPIPGWARCYPRQLWMPTEESLMKDAAVRKRFELIVGRLLLHLSGSSATCKLLAPFRVFDFLHKGGWLRSLPREPWCCHGERSGEQPSSISAALRKAVSITNSSFSVRVTVHMKEAVMCEDQRLPGGYQHVSGFSGIVYNATVTFVPPVSSILQQGDSIVAQGKEQFYVHRAGAPDLETEVARCSAQAELMHASMAKQALGNPECWSDGFDFVTCCAPEFGPTGNLQCWDSTFTYEYCCTEH